MGSARNVRVTFHAAWQRQRLGQQWDRGWGGVLLAWYWWGLLRSSPCRVLRAICIADGTLRLVRRVTLGSLRLQLPWPFVEGSAGVVRAAAAASESVHPLGRVHSQPPPVLTASSRQALGPVLSAEFCVLAV